MRFVTGNEFGDFVQSGSIVCKFLGDLLVQGDESVSASENVSTFR